MIQHSPIIKYYNRRKNGDIERKLNYIITVNNIKDYVGKNNRVDMSEFYETVLANG